MTPLGVTDHAQLAFIDERIEVRAGNMEKLHSLFNYEFFDLTFSVGWPRYWRAVNHFASIGCAMVSLVRGGLPALNSAEVAGEASTFAASEVDTAALLNETVMSCG